MRIQILILGFQRLSAGVQGLDFALGLWWRTPIMVWIIKRVCSHYCPVSTVLRNGVWTALNSGSHVRRKCKCKSKRRSQRRTQTQRRQDTQARSRTVKLSPRWLSRVKLWPQEVYFSWFSNIECLRDENNRYLYNATENVRLYCKLFEIHFCIKSDCICCLYFLSLNKRFLVPWFFCHIFSGKSFL